ncbi:hypothetical protein DAD186_00910 [Dermabacter vaginalis]|uniref:Uncharacterized protein n=1 Tax=Dermabacter vaginalis TaxID=1630135 RepID=A0A1B0ZFD8_9MICO|nr:DUF6507 family protein [Dermabacter vaginalis]ANP26650.1 hypothetical protein DAD186_00910 [Dermabacter vaginalis]
MKLNILFSEVDSSIEYAEWQMSEMEHVKSFTEETTQAAASALSHSPFSAIMVERCLQFFVLNEVDHCYNRASINMEATREAVGHYADGDQQMSENSSQAMNSLNIPDMPGVNTSGTQGIPYIEGPIDVSKPYEFSNDVPLLTSETLPGAFNQSLQTEDPSHPPVCTPEDAGPFKYQTSPNFKSTSPQTSGE